MKRKYKRASRSGLSENLMRLFESSQMWFGPRCALKQIEGALVLACVFLHFGCASQSTDWTEHEGFRYRALAMDRGDAGFELLSADRTGLVALNAVSSDTIVFNRHFMHGSGIAIGDVDNDARPDIFVARLTAPDVLYRNLGSWQFEDITSTSGLPLDSYASTGAVLVDIDGDRDLDLLVTMLTGPNAVYLNDGQGRFTSAAMGLQSSYASTTMTLADIDGDTDLDMYVTRYKRIALSDSLPHDLLTWDNVLADTSWNVKPDFQAHYVFRRSGSRIIRSELGEPDALYLNSGQGYFEQQPWSGGRFRDARGDPIMESPRHWGLTARFHDVNGDLIPDLYVCNDFDSPDAFFLGQGDGAFRQVPPEALRQTSNATMSVDFSDINRDGNVDFFMTDMLSRDYSRRQRQRNTRIPEEAQPGDLAFIPQEMQNMLMLSRGDETWAAISNLASVAASDWSWSTAFLDVDLDGYEDILITTGHLFDVQDLDAQAKEEIQLTRTRSFRRARQMILEFPALSLPNVAFRNRGDLTFEDMPDGWGFGSLPDVAHGMAVGDLDLDGDLDVVTNRLNDTPAVYRNRSDADRIAVRLYGNAPNTAGVGSNVRLECPGLPMQQKEITAGGMYLSGSQMQVTFAAAQADCRIEVQWRAGMRSVVPNAERNRLYEIRESGAETIPTEPEQQAAMPRFRLAGSYAAPADEVYEDFARQPLLPWHLSRYSPALLLHDVDADGTDDIILGGGQQGQTVIYGSRVGPIELGMLPGEVTSLAAASVQTGSTRLFAASSNYERSPARAADSSWIYVYEITPSGAWRLTDRLLFGQSAPGPISLFDADQDGDLDLFAGGHFVPGRYPEPATSRVFLNNTGRYEPSPRLSRPFESLGVVSSSAFGDLDNDGDLDAVLGLEWGPVRVFLREGANFVDRTHALGLQDLTGWWRAVALGDFDADGRLDIAGANAGWNTRYGQTGPVRLNYADLDANGLMDIIESSMELPARNLFDLGSAIPPLRQRFSSYRSFAEARAGDLWPNLDRTTRIVEATTLGSAVFLNQGDRFVMRPLPVEAQFSTSAALAVMDANLDGHQDLVLGQNWFALPTAVARQDAGRTQLLLGTGAGEFAAVDGGFRMYGEARGVAAGDLNNDGRVDVVIAQHSAPVQVYLNQGDQIGLQVRLQGVSGNPDAIGAQIRVEYADGAFGPVRNMSPESNGVPRVILGLAAEPARVHVRWPDGRNTAHELTAGQERITIRQHD